MSDNFDTKDASGANVRLASSASADATPVHASKQVSFTTSVAVTLTRPNDTNAYTASDAITSATSSAAGYTFAGCARVAGGCGTILDAKLILSNLNAVLGNFEVWLFDTLPAIPNDNAAFSFTDAEANNVVAVLKFNSSDYSDSALNRVYHMSNPPRQFKCAAADTQLFGVLKTINAIAAITAQETFKLKLDIVQDS